MRTPFLLSVLLMLGLVLSGCEPGARDLRYGEEDCAYCMMRVTDPPFGSQLVTEHGRVYPFDSVECLTAFVENEGVAPEEIHSVWVPDFAEPEGEWLPAEEAHYLQSDELQSPMGFGLTAFGDETAAEEHAAEYDGRLYDWDEVRSVVRTDWLEDTSHQQGH